MNLQKFAIIKCKEKQYKVVEGDLIYTEQIHKNVGEKMQIEDILLYGDQNKTIIGHPHLDGVKVSATVLRHIKNEKVVIFKKRRRKNSRRKRGHRQELTVIQVDKIISTLS